MAKNLLKRSPDIETMVPYWNEVTAILEGYQSIKKAGSEFLPMFPDEADSDYDVRLENTKFTNVYKDVVEGLACKPFENKVTLLKTDDGQEIPQELVDFVENVDGSGNNLSVFAALTFFNGLNYGIDWILVDYPTVENADKLTIAEAKSMNIKPYWVHILGKNVLDIKTKMIGSKEVIIYFKCQEPGYLDEPVKVKEFMVNPDTGKVEWKLYEKRKNKDEDVFIIIDSGEMSIGYIPIVPFTTGRRDGKSFRFYPPMQDAADLQIILYRNESALEYIKTLACYPMLATDGIKVPMESDGRTPKKIKVGPNRTLFGIPMDNGSGGKWHYVEPNANSLEFLKKDIDRTKQDLRELGRQPLTALSSQLTTVTTSVAAGKAKSAVTAWALSLKDALENALIITLEWMKIEYDPMVNVYDGFDNMLETDADVNELSKARERGDISRETWWSEMQRRKILSPEFNAKTEAERLLNEVGGGIDTFNREEEDTQ